MPQGNERRRRGATETEGGVHSSGILLGWNIFAARSVSTIDVNTVLDPEAGTLPPTHTQVPTVLPTGIKPQWKRYGGQHLKTLINGYFCIRRRERETIFC